MSNATYARTILALCMFGLILALSGCQSVSDTLKAVDYACVDIEIEARTTDSGVLGRGIILPEGETLSDETVERLCNY